MTDDVTFAALAEDFVAAVEAARQALEQSVRVYTNTVLARTLGVLGEPLWPDVDRVAAAALSAPAPASWQPWRPWRVPVY